MELFKENDRLELERRTYVHILFYMVAWGTFEITLYDWEDGELVKLVTYVPEIKTEEPDIVNISRFAEREGIEFGDIQEYNF